MLRQVWQADNLRLFGTAEDFARAIAPRLDKTRTFGNNSVTSTQVNDFLKEFYDTVVKGELEDIPVTRHSLYKERETFASRQTKNRVIHLASAEDTLFVMKTFGEGNVTSSMFNSMITAARKTSIAEQLGLNPRATVRQLQIVAKRDARPEIAARIERPTTVHALRYGNVEAMLNIIDGSFDRMSDPTLAMRSHILSNVTRASLLQMVLTSAVPDLVTTWMANARIGASVAQNISSRMDWAFRGMSGKTKRLLAGAFDTANSYNVGALTQRTAATGVTAKMSNITSAWSNATMKYSGLNAWTRWGKGSSAVPPRS
jgi:hypothetical protein